MKRPALIMMALGLVAFALSWPLGAAEKKQAARSTLADEAFTAKQRPPSVFGHDEHMELESGQDCYGCHHQYKDGKLVKEESSDGTKCVECHPVNPGKNQTRLLSAYHNLCKKCHEKEKKGPLACGQCHVKK
ncbi:MAG: acidic tetraheme cytochrome c3 TmcA [Thermodesulfobacteriota bacterium]